MSNKKILTTGGAGFIGSAVIRHIIHNTGHSVINVDKLTYAGNLESLVSVENNSRYAFEQVDMLLAGETMERIMLKGGWKSESTVMRYLRAMVL